jgi:prepilin-type N-terminal cleavage/methylation domain-containing protein
MNQPKPRNQASSSGQKVTCGNSMALERSNSRNRGMTLIELIIVISVFGILMGIGVANFMHFRGSSDLRVAAEKLAGDLRYVRTTAVARGRTYQLVLDPFNNPYDYIATDGSGGDTLLRRDLPTGIEIEWFHNPISFTPRGLTDYNTIVVLRGNDSLVISVTGTGTVMFQE